MRQLTNISVFQTAENLAEAAANLLVKVSKQSIKNRGKFVVAISGGNTPENLYALLAKPPYHNQIEWDKTFVFWGDERVVPSNDKLNNAFMAKTIWLNHVDIPLKNIYTIPVDVAPAKAAEDYESSIKNLFGNNSPQFDLIFLGLGENGHTASLFPGSNIIFERTKLVREVYVAEKEMYRITMTPHLINKAHHIVFLVAGKNKASILKAVLTGLQQPDKLPAQVIKPENGILFWFVDKAAAALLPSKLGYE